MDRKEYIILTVKDLVKDFLYYGRKEDEDLPRGEIEEALKKKEISIDEIVSEFANTLEVELDS